MFKILLINDAQTLAVIFTLAGLTYEAYSEYMLLEFGSDNCRLYLAAVWTEIKIAGLLFLLGIVCNSNLTCCDNL